MKRTGRLRRKARLRKWSERKRRRDEVFARHRAVVKARCHVEGSRRAYACERCATVVGNAYFEVHHLLPRARGGGHCIENLVGLCFGCHAAIHQHAVEDLDRWLLHGTCDNDHLRRDHSDS